MNQQTIKLSLLASHKLGAVQLEKDDKGFHILQNGKKTPVNSYDVDPLLRKMNCDQLKAFQKHGYVTGKKLSNGEYTIKAHVRGLGGGPICGAIAYWITKSAMYGTAGVVGATAVTGVVAASGGGAIPAMIGVGIAKTALAGTTVGMAVVGTGVVSTVGASTAAVGTMSVVAATGGSIPTTIALVESCSAAAGAFFSALLFLP